MPKNVINLKSVHVTQNKLYSLPDLRAQMTLKYVGETLLEHKKKFTNNNYLNTSMKATCVTYSDVRESISGNFDYYSIGTHSVLKKEAKLM
jgi:hypothetical protein